MSSKESYGDRILFNRKQIERDLVPNLLKEIGRFNSSNNFPILNTIICGGYRRKVEEIHDLDIVFKVDYEKSEISPFMFNLNFTKSMEILGLTDFKFYKNRITCKAKNGFKIEIYITENNEEYEVMKLVRTGSFIFNTTIAESARKMNPKWVLKFSGDHFGLFGLCEDYNPDKEKYEEYINISRRIATEKDIIVKVLGRYFKPEERNL